MTSDAMNLKNKLAVTATILAVMAVVIAQQHTHKQYHPDRSSIITHPAVRAHSTLRLSTKARPRHFEIRNITIYFHGQATSTVNGPQAATLQTISHHYQVLTTSASPGGGNIYLYSVQFTIPTWYGSLNGNSNCPGAARTRDTHLLWMRITRDKAQTTCDMRPQAFSISMAIPTYEAPVS